MTDTWRDFAKPKANTTLEIARSATPSSLYLSSVLAQELNRSSLGRKSINWVDVSLAKSGSCTVVVAAETEVAEALQDEDDVVGEGGVASTPPTKPKKGKAALPLKRDRVLAECFASGTCCDSCSYIDRQDNIENKPPREAVVEWSIEHNPNAFRPTKIVGSPHYKCMRVSLQGFVSKARDVRIAAGSFWPNCNQYSFT
ncbi:unnamed protein product [Ilex paraguariensis]|uniref:Uncharacterized protein n=1 Tax=Ilex paraguariensis TaxID=185542 RepID=A0ABC8S5Z6_9AQUA